MKIDLTKKEIKELIYYMFYYEAYRNEKLLNKLCKVGKVKFEEIEHLTIENY